MKLHGYWLALCGLATIAAAAGTQQDLAARFPYDLGPAEVDVSAYPPAVQKGYASFRHTCSKCHSTARPLNAPIVKREDWQRFVKRMHVKPGSKFKAAAMKPIIEFLTYDSKVRKVDQKESFDALSRKLEERFDAGEAERKKHLREEDDKNIKTPAPYTGAKP